jgi:hypothetical protein
MIKLQSSYNKIIKIFLVMSFFSFSHFGLAGELPNIQLGEAVAIALQETSKISDDNPLFSLKREQKSGEGLEVLLGTWDFSYSIGVTSHTSKVELTKIVVFDENEAILGENKMASGQIYRDERRIEERIGCVKIDNPLLDRATNTNYSCSTDRSVRPLLMFGFRVTGNNITNGIFSYGENVDEVGTNFAKNSSPFLAIPKDRTNSSVKADRLEAFYFLIEDELDIPVVNYQGSKYRVILKNEGNFIFSIKHVLPTLLAIEGDQAVYNESNHELIIPVVKHDYSKYRIVLEDKGNFLFSIKEIQSF